MKRSFLAALGLSLMTAFSAAAQDVPPAPEITVKGTVFPYVGLVDLPVCTNHEGVNANYVTYGETDKLIMTPLGSSSMGWDGKPEIIYDHEWMPYIPEIAQKFILNHECHHVKNNDLRLLIQARQESSTREMYQQREQELEDRADCQTVQQMKEGGEFSSAEQIEGVFNAIAPMIRYYGIEDSNINARVTKLQKCYAGDLSAMQLSW